MLGKTKFTTAFRAALPSAARKMTEEEYHQAVDEYFHKVYVNAHSKVEVMRRRTEILCNLLREFGPDKDLEEVRRIES